MSMTRRNALAAAGAALAATVALPAAAEAASAAQNADADLIALGRQFDALRAACRPLDAESDRLYVEYQRIAAERGLAGQWGPAATKAQCAVMKECGYKAAAVIRNRCHGRLVRVARRIHHMPPATTVEGVAIKLDAAVFELFDYALTPDADGLDLGRNELPILHLSREVRALALKA